MSLEHKEMITCPDCGMEGEFVIWQSINTQLDPQAKTDLLSGQLFAYTCPHCKSVHNIYYDLLYHQMENELMIHYASSDENVAEAIETFEEMASGDLIPGISSMGMNYTFRVVYSQNQLREKAYIFDMGLDDRAVELMKVMIVTKLSETNSDVEIEEMFLEITENQPERFAIRLSNGNWGSTGFSQEMYNAIKNEMIDPEDDGKREYIVNMHWAIEKLKNM